MNADSAMARGGIQAEMNGTGDQYRLEQERFGRIGCFLKSVFECRNGSG